MSKKIKKLYEMCMKIRAVENKIIERYSEDIFQSPVHLSIGQEMIAVCVMELLNKNDTVFTNYRGHAHYLARGGDLTQFFAELAGKEGGISRGRAGSMHLSWKAGNLIGASAVVGTSFSNAVGMAYAKKLSGDHSLTVCFFGDGATEQGSFFESLNLAKLLDVRIVFVLEDNDLAVHIPKSGRQTFDLSKLVSAFGINYLSVSASSPPELLERLEPAFNSLRNSTNNNQLFLRIQTYRAIEHVGVIDDTDHPYRRTKNSLDTKYTDILDEFKFDEEFISRINHEIDWALTQALAMPDANPMTIMENV